VRAGCRIFDKPPRVERALARFARPSDELDLPYEGVRRHVRPDATAILDHRLPQEPMRQPGYPKTSSSVFAARRSAVSKPSVKRA
jgi:hypothetical protein